MEGFVQTIVEGYIIFLFFDGLLLFSLIKWLRQDMRSIFSVLIDSFR